LDRFRELEMPPMARTKDVVLMATVSSFEGMPHPGRHELKQFAELFEPVFKASSQEARRNAIAALSRCPVVPQSVTWFIACQPIGLAALFLTRSPAIDDDTLIAIARTQGTAHAKAIAARDNLSVKVVDALVALHNGAENTQKKAPPADTFAAPPNLPDPEEHLRQHLKSLVLRDTLARAEDLPEQRDAMRSALLVRFARLKQTRLFSTCLADAMASSRWLSDRILLDLSGQQLATALIAIGIDRSDGEFILGALYPHLLALDGAHSRASLVWAGLDPEAAETRVRTWIRADDFTQGKAPEQNPANRNENGVEEIGERQPQRPVFGRARHLGRGR
jgi:uncharacterized protein (DUF2336 family)